MGPLFTSIFGLRSPVIAQVPQGVLAIHGVYAHGTRFVRLAELLCERQEIQAAISTLKPFAQRSHAASEFLVRLLSSK